MTHGHPRKAIKHLSTNDREKLSSEPPHQGVLDPQIEA